jgi:hypothetical protein
MIDAPRGFEIYFPDSRQLVYSRIIGSEELGAVLAQVLQLDGRDVQYVEEADYAGNLLGRRVLYVDREVTEAKIDTTVTRIRSMGGFIADAAAEQTSEAAIAAARCHGVTLRQLFRPLKHD